MSEFAGVADWDLGVGLQAPAPLPGTPARAVMRGDGKIYASVRATQYDGFQPTHVSACAQGRRQLHGGFTWAFVDQLVDATP